ncbi:MAG: glycosyltransferase family 39 protein [Thermoleophilia bacterium]|nr:glycosyltransferase family 39 protein [Thermoleophilia bacterium]
MIPLEAGIGERAPRLVLALSLGAVLAFVLLITLPFAGQAFHIDDAIFWDFARHSQESPWQQHLADYRLMGIEIPEFRDTHPPLDELYLSAIMRVTGSDSELPLHLGFIIFPVIAGFSMLFLARRFTRNALLATMLMLATPVLMTSSHTLMGDLPMTAFWLVATTAYIYGVDRDDTRLLALAGVAAALAVFTGYQALALILLLPAYALLKQKLTWKNCLPLLLPVLGFAAYTLYSLERYGALPRFKHARGLSLGGSSVLYRIEGNLVQLGGAAVFPLFAAGAYCLKRRRWILLLPVAAGSIALSYYYYSQSSSFPAASAMLFAVFLAAAGIVVVSVSAESWVQLADALKRRRVDTDFVFLAFWLLAMMSVVMLLLPHATAKYSLPFLAPLVLLIFRELESGIRSESVVSLVAAIAVALTFMAGVAVSSADNRLAQAYKDFSMEFGERYQPEGQVWFVGEWGLRHYMEGEGYRYLTSASMEPAEGDLVVRAGLMDWPLDNSVVQRLELVDSTGVRSDDPIRVMNFAANAGLYGSHWGKLPFTFSDRPVETFDIYRVKPEQVAGEGAGGASEGGSGSVGGDDSSAGANGGAGGAT